MNADSGKASHKYDFAYFQTGRPNNMKKYYLMPIFILLLFCMLTGCGRKQIEVSQTFFYFDTSVTVTLYGTKNEQAHLQQVMQQVMQLCDSYEAMLSRTKEGSDIYRINHAAGEWTSVNQETVSLIYTALNYCDLTDGQIDITIAPVKDLWQLDAAGHTLSIPDKQSLAQALSHVSYRGVEIDGSKIRLSDPDAAIDLGFIAKGFIADEIKALLIAEKVDGALIDLGGNIAVLGEKPDGNAFRIGIQTPFADRGEYSAVVEASDQPDHYSAVVTSGVYERYAIYEDTLYHHVLDAHTGRPVQNHLYSVTILTASAVNADALSTTCLVKGLDWSLELISSLDGVDAIFITDDQTLIDTRKDSQ